MYEQVEKPKGNKSRAAAKTVGQKKSKEKQGFSFVDNRPESVVQRKLSIKQRISCHGSRAESLTCGYKNKADYVEDKIRKLNRSGNDSGIRQPELTIKPQLQLCIKTTGDCIQRGKDEEKPLLEDIKTLTVFTVEGGEKTYEYEDPNQSETSILYGKPNWYELLEDGKIRKRWLSGFKDKFLTKRVGVTEDGKEVWEREGVGKKIGNIMEKNIPQLQTLNEQFDTVENNFKKLDGKLKDKNIDISKLKEEVARQKTNIAIEVKNYNAKTEEEKEKVKKGFEKKVYIAMFVVSAIIAIVQILISLIPTLPVWAVISINSVEIVGGFLTLIYAFRIKGVNKYAQGGVIVGNILLGINGIVGLSTMAYGLSQWVLNLGMIPGSIFLLKYFKNKDQDTAKGIEGNQEKDDKKVNGTVIREGTINVDNISTPMTQEEINRQNVYQQNLQPHQTINL